jgi:hypothetical protein
VFRTEGQALNFIRRSRIAKGTVVNTDESANRNALHSQFEMKRINQGEAYSLDGACTNCAEGFSAACAAPRSITITISRALICSGTRKRCHGAKTTAALQTEIR